MNGQDKAANSIRNFRWPSIVIMVVATSMLSSAGINGKVIADNTPRYVATAKNLGSEDSTKVIEVSIWLQLHDQSKFDALTASLYDSSSANYRHFLKPQEIAARFGPTAEEAKTVRQFFEDHKLTVVKTGSDNFYVRARGTVGEVEKAFHVQLNNYEVRGKTVRANVGDPYVEGPAGELVRAVSGLDSGGFEHHVIVRQSGLSGKPLALAKPAAVADSDFFSSQCFTGTETETVVNNGSGFPIGTYKGNQLNLGSATGLGCAYTPPVIQNAYNLTALYNEHGQPRGADQTIAIIDWCGSATILNDVNAFSAQFGLPQLIPADQFQQPSTILFRSHRATM
jgi:subtilase family serine protease